MRYSNEYFQYIVRAIVDIFVRRRSPMIARIACLDRLMLVATPWSLCAQRYAADFDQEPSDDLVSPGHHGGVAGTVPSAVPTLSLVDQAEANARRIWRSPEADAAHRVSPGQRDTSSSRGYPGIRDTTSDSLLSSAISPTSQVTIASYGPMTRSRAVMPGRFRACYALDRSVSAAKWTMM